MDQELFIFILEIEIQLFKLTQCTFMNSNFVNTNFYNNTQSYILPFNTFSFITFNILLPWESDLYEKFLNETWKLNNTLAKNLLRPCNLNNTIHIRWGIMTLTLFVGSRPTRGNETKFSRIFSPYEQSACYWATTHVAWKRATLETDRM